MSRTTFSELSPKFKLISVGMTQKVSGLMFDFRSTEGNNKCLNQLEARA